MSNYLDTLNNTQKANANLIIETAKENGITNPITIGAILSIVSKESNFIPKEENLNYSAKRITEVWKKIPMSMAQNLANNPIQLANYVYGGKFGNNNVNDGFLFRGRGFNQLTFKGNYKKIGELIKKDLISNPDIVNNPKVASQVLIAFYKLAEKRHKLNLNNLGTQKQTIDTIYQINAGKVNKPISDTTGGYKRALNRFDDLLVYAGGHKKEIGGTFFFLIALITYYLYKKKSKK
jgi:predicted chitinase